MTESQPPDSQDRDLPITHPKSFRELMDEVERNAQENKTIETNPEYSGPVRLSPKLKKIAKENLKLREMSFIELRDQYTNLEAALSKFRFSDLSDTDFRKKIQGFADYQLEYWTVLSSQNDPTEVILLHSRLRTEVGERAHKAAVYCKNGYQGLLLLCYDQATFYTNQDDPVYTDRTNKSVAENWIKHAQRIYSLKDSE